MKSFTDTHSYRSVLIIALHSVDEYRLGTGNALIGPNYPTTYVNALLA